jgi:hypothetical protein
MLDPGFSKAEKLFIHIQGDQVVTPSPSLFTLWASVQTLLDELLYKSTWDGKSPRLYVLRHKAQVAKVLFDVPKRLPEPAVWHSKATLIVRGLAHPVAPNR